jgi:DNA polymerase III delta prime subunit
MTTSTLEASKLYVSKYRPQNLDEIIGNEKIVTLFKYYLRERKFPNMLIIGPTGCGKNTIINLFVKEYLGANVRTHLLEIVGSLYRGRCIINNAPDMKNVDRTVPNISNFVKRSVLPKDLLKIVIIYDFNYITSETQIALRRMMDSNLQSLRFIISCNEVDSIMEVIQSRCNIYRLDLPSDDQIRQLVEHVVTTENLDIGEEIIDEIIIQADGNIRCALNNLQLIRHHESINIENLYSVLNIPPNEIINKMFSACRNKDDEDAIAQVRLLLDNGYSIVDVFNIVQKYLIKTTTLTPEQKVHNIEILAYFFLIPETSLSVNNLYHLVYKLIDR